MESKQTNLTKSKKKTYYVIVECQGNPVMVVKAEALTADEAYGKAAKALLGNYRFSTASKGFASNYAETMGVYVLDEEGSETDI